MGERLTSARLPSRMTSSGGVPTSAAAWACAAVLAGSSSPVGESEKCPVSSTGKAVVICASYSRSGFDSADTSSRSKKHSVRGSRPKLTCS
eukprot:57295-Pleurochrysis_carterae.AAC.3